MGKGCQTRARNAIPPARHFRASPGLPPQACNGRLPTMSAKSTTPPRRPGVFRFLFLVMFLLGGLGLVREGLRAIGDRAYVLRYAEELSWASESERGSSGAESRAAEFGGREAVVFGVGFAALGGMLLLWAAGLALGFAAQAGLRVPRGVYRGLAGLSLAALAAASLALFPAWQLRTLPFYVVLLAFTLALALPVPAHVRKKVFPGAVMAVILAGLVGFPAFPIFAGIVGFLAAGTHLLVIWPNLVPPSLSAKTFTQPAGMSRPPRRTP